MPAVRRPLRSRRRSGNAQSLVEFALLSPVLILLIFGAIDISRAVYEYNAISSATREGARLVALKPQVNSDCDPLQRMESAGQSFSLTQDPNSVIDGTTPPKNTDPNDQKIPPPPSQPGIPAQGPSTPASGQGYVYIYPAVAPSTSVCDSSTARGHTLKGTVTVEISYGFTPVTPLISGIFGSIVMRSTSVVSAGY